MFGVRLMSWQFFFSIFQWLMDKAIELALWWFLFESLCGGVSMSVYLGLNLTEMAMELWSTGYFPGLDKPCPLRSADIDPWHLRHYVWRYGPRSLQIVRYMVCNPVGFFAKVDFCCCCFGFKRVPIGQKWWGSNFQTPPSFPGGSMLGAKMAYYRAQ